MEEGTSLGNYPVRAVFEVARFFADDLASLVHGAADLITRISAPAPATLRVKDVHQPCTERRAAERRPHHPCVFIVEIPLIPSLFAAKGEPLSKSVIHFSSYAFDKD